MLEVELAQQFVGFAAACERDGAVTYGAICRSIATDPDLLDITSEAPLAQRRPNIVLAAVHYLLLGGADHPLVAHYDTVRPDGAAVGTGDVAPIFRDFCLTHRPQITELVRTRSTQTNEVRRCTTLLPALCQIAAGTGGGDLGLIDLGTSAGLNLLVDRYAYTYSADDSGETRRSGAPGSPVQLECLVRSGLHDLPALSVPTIVERVGLDLSPIDAHSDDEARWLLACLWPDALPRFARLQAALATWRAEDPAPRIVRGDMIDDLPEVAASLDGTGPLVVFHSWAVAYLPEDRQRALLRVISSLNARRPTHHLYAEVPYETPGLPSPPSPYVGPGARAATALVQIGPDQEPQRWADVHPHGNWIRWFGPH